MSLTDWWLLKGVSPMQFSLFLNLAAVILWLGACGAGPAKPELQNSPTPIAQATQETTTDIENSAATSPPTDLLEISPNSPLAPSVEATVASEPNSPIVTPSPTESPDEAVQNKPMAPLDSAIIIFRRSGGIAGVDELWKIYPDGRIEGPENQQQQVDRAKVQALLEMIQTAGFFELDDSYVPRNNCCDRFTYEIAVQLENKTKTVTAGEASPVQPEQLTKVIEAINRLLFALK
jgi:hypothetical protein